MWNHCVVHKKLVRHVNYTSIQKTNKGRIGVWVSYYFRISPRILCQYSETFQAPPVEDPSKDRTRMPLVLLN